MGPIIAGLETANITAASVAFGFGVGLSFAAGSLGYATEEWINGRNPNFKSIVLNGIMVSSEGAAGFVVGGIVGSVGKIGTTGKFLKSKEWIGKTVYTKEFTFPLNYLLDWIRRKIN